MGLQAPDARRQDRQHRRRHRAQGLTTSATTSTRTPGPATSSRVRASAAPALGALGVGAAVGWLHHTGGYAVVPGGLLTCPLHAVTGLSCPFCGGLRAVAALSNLDVATALSANAAVVALLPVVAAGWLVVLLAAVRGRPDPVPRVGNRGWLALSLGLLVFTVWRNLPGLPGADYLAP